MLSSVAGETDTPRPTSQSTSRSEKLSAANALPRKPDSVMATWMVARNFAGSAVSFASRYARRSPFAANLFSLFSFI